VHSTDDNTSVFILLILTLGGSIAEWLVCWTEAQKGL